jgi:glycosyltransferase involved in cell wall biosynthesis
MANSTPAKLPFCASIGIFAWNEEEAIATTLESLLQQSFFVNLNARGQRCEVVCVLNGCTDNTATVAAEVLARQSREHRAAEAFSGRVVHLSERGKMNAWNQFVHHISAPEVRVLIMMDADIVIHRPDTVWNMFTVLEQDPQAAVAVDQPRKGLVSQRRQTLRHFISSGMTQMTQAAEAQLCGQLYAMRGSCARQIHLPRDLGACEDGFLKVMVCTDLLTQPVNPSRIRLAPDAEHTFEAYTSPGAILKNQKRQIIGQTIVHLLVDRHLNKMPLEQRREMARSLRDRDRQDPDWLKRLVADHLQQVRFFWRLYPNLLAQHFRRLGKVRGLSKVGCLPAALAGFLTGLIAGYWAFRSMKRGVINYWPKPRRLGLEPLGRSVAANAPAGANH